MAGVYPLRHSSRLKVQQPRSYPNALKFYSLFTLSTVNCRLLTNLSPTSHESRTMTRQLTFNLMPTRPVWTVSELTARIRDLLAKNFTDISVQGEI